MLAGLLQAEADKDSASENSDANPAARMPVDRKKIVAPSGYEHWLVGDGVDVSKEPKSKEKVKAKTKA